MKLNGNQLSSIVGDIDTKIKKTQEGLYEMLK